MYGGNEDRQGKQEGMKGASLGKEGRKVGLRRKQEDGW